VVGELRRHLDGGSAYCGCTGAPSGVKARDPWVLRRLRCSLGKQGGRRRSRERRHRGVSRDLAWNTVTSAHGPWRISRSLAWATALPGRYFDGLGLPRLQRGSPR
jgi:RNA-directed DNA polymerase